MVLSNEFTRARATLLVLSAPMTRKPGEDVTSIWLNGIQMSSERAVEELASVPKPVECASQLEHRKLLIKCEGVTGQSDETVEGDWADATSDGIIGSVVERFGDQADLPLLLRSQFDSLIIDARDTRRWFRDYRLTGFTLSLFLEDQAAKVEDALGSLVVSKPISTIRSNLHPSDLEAPE